MIAKITDTGIYDTTLDQNQFQKVIDFDTIASGSFRNKISLTMPFLSKNQ